MPERARTWFIGCHSQETIRPTREGVVEFTPEREGTVSYCVRLRNEYAGDCDRVEVTVTIAPRPGETPAELQALLTSFAGKLKNVRMAIETIKRPRRQKCPDEMMALPPDQAKLEVYDLDYVTQIETGSTAPGTSAGFGPWRHRYAKLYEKAPGSLGPHSNWAKTIQSFQKTKYAVFVRTDDVVMPQVTGGDTFVGGQYKGWAFVGDLQSGSVACQTRFDFRTSKTITWTETVPEAEIGLRYGISPQEGQFRVQVDFFNNGLTALQEAIKGIGPTLSVTYQ
jgi:hypothetical protein